MKSKPTKNILKPPGYVCVLCICEEILDICVSQFKLNLTGSAQNAC